MTDATGALSRSSPSALIADLVGTGSAPAATSRCLERRHRALLPPSTPPKWRHACPPLQPKVRRARSSPPARRPWLPAEILRKGTSGDRSRGLHRRHRELPLSQTAQAGATWPSTSNHDSPSSQMAAGILIDPGPGRAEPTLFGPVTESTTDEAERAKQAGRSSWIALPAPPAIEWFSTTAWFGIGGLSRPSRPMPRASTSPIQSVVLLGAGWRHTGRWRGPGSTVRHADPWPPSAMWPRGFGGLLVGDDHRCGAGPAQESARRPRADRRRGWFSLSADRARRGIGRIAAIASAPR